MTMKTTPIFKVTTASLESCLANRPNFLPELVVKYSTEHFVFAPSALPNSSLFCFTDLERAKRFVYRNHQRDSWLVWEAVGINVRPKKAIIVVNRHFASRVFQFWTSVIGRFGFRRRSKAGFFVADGIQLVKVIATANECYPVESQLP